MQIQRILVPVDGSDYADRAVALAGDMAGKFDAELILVHVLLTGLDPGQVKEVARKAGVKVPTLSIHGSYVDTSRQREMLEEIGNGLLERASKAATDAGTEKVQTLIEQGPTARTILKKAKKKKVDLIVMGSRGLGSLKGLLIGSVSHKVQNLAECTVISVK